MSSELETGFARRFGKGLDAAVVEVAVAIEDDLLDLLLEADLRDERADTVDTAKKLFRETPEVQQAYYVTGGTSFVLIIVTRDMATYEGITRRLFSESDVVSGFRSLVTLDRVKADTALAIE